jgi:hypothetical protein
MPDLVLAVGVAEKFRREEFNTDRTSDRFEEVEFFFAVAMYPWRVGNERLIVCTDLDCLK